MGDLLDDLAGGVGKIAGGPGAVAGSAAREGLEVAGNKVSERVAAEAQSQIEEFLWDLAQSTVDGTQYFFHMMFDLLLRMTEPQVTGEFIYTMGGRLFFISLPLIVAFAAMRIIAASLRAQALTGARDAFLGAGASVLGSIALVPLTAVAVRAVDALANGLMNATLKDGDEFVDEVMAAVVQIGTRVGNTVAGEPLAAGPIGPWDVPAGGVIVTALTCICACALLLLSCLIIGLALVARNMLLYIVIVVGPLCLSGLAWQPTRRWASIWMGWMVALIFTKLAIVVVMGLGVLAVTATIQSGEVAADPLPGLMTVLSGVLMLVLAAFMPLACFALFGWMGEASVREIQNAASGAQGALQSVAASGLSASQTATGRLGSMMQSGGDSVGSEGLVGGSGSGDSGGDTGGGGGGGLAQAGTASGHPAAAVAAVAAEKVGATGEAAVSTVKEGLEDTVSETTDSGGAQFSSGGAEEAASREENPWVDAGRNVAPESGAEPSSLSEAAQPPADGGSLAEEAPAVVERPQPGASQPVDLPVSEPAPAEPPAPPPVDVPREAPPEPISEPTEGGR